ncbi:hypothetical protein [Brachybacterium sp. FME24]|uniref:hypothetical protein n=1 Tax=Brachybacterium sp. FME24 TaxID=2742605 RepID=UPI0018678406|nr:hypothetical protein [Brachybacterium sp. FME24]
MREIRTRLSRPASKCVLVTVTALSLVGCTTEASNADPETKTFSYSGETLILKTNEVATDVVATDREDIQVTRWFEHTAGFERLTWELDGDTLEIDAGCHGIALCDARFEVEVPQDLQVERG